VYFNPQDNPEPWYTDPSKSLRCLTEDRICTVADAIQSFGLPVTRAQIDRLTQQRGEREWYRLARINVDDERRKAAWEALDARVRQLMGLG
jgi:hypothetical protein